MSGDIYINIIILAHQVPWAVFFGEFIQIVSGNFQSKTNASGLMWRLIMIL